jgi:hypothetical protein
MAADKRVRRIIDIETILCGAPQPLVPGRNF